MALATAADLAAAMEVPQLVEFTKTQAQAVAATMQWASMFDRSGSPAAGTLAGTSTGAGVVPAAGNTGFPAINAFGGGNTGYLGSVSFATPAAANIRYRLVDLLWKGGAYPFNAAVTLSAQPSYSARLPGTDYKGTEIWVEAVTAFTGTPSIAVTYTNQDGTTGRTTGTISMGSALAASRLIQLPLQAGDTGVQKIESVTATVATVGTFNVLVVRPLWMSYVGGGFDLFHGPDLTDLPVVYATSALYWMGSPQNSTSLNAFDVLLGIIQG